MKRWTLPDYEKHKALIRDELLAVDEQEGTAKKLEYVLDQVNDLGGEADPESELRRLIYILNAIAHEAAHHSLGESQLKNLVDLAHAILRTNGIKPRSSRLSVIFGDLYLLMSQAYMARGSFWLSAWQQQISGHLAGASIPGGEAYQSLSMAAKTLRLGNAAAALRMYREAEKGKLSESLIAQARIGQIRCYRFLMDLEAAENLAEKSSDLLASSEDLKNEMEWEAACRRVQLTGELDDMVPLFMREASHYEASYVLEGFFWASCVGTYKWLKKLAKVRTLARNKTLMLKKAGVFYKCAVDLEEIYESERPLLFRLNKAEVIFYKTKRLRNVDKELLVWLSLARWLARVNHPGLAALVLEEYAALSQRVSAGRSRDVLGVSADLLEKEWAFQGFDLPSAG